MEVHHIRQDMRDATMTLNQHFAAAREITITCQSIHRLWLITGDVDSPLRPEGKALAVVRKIRDRLKRRFLDDFPGQYNPYEDIDC
jgi:hypothetical protein